MIVRFHSAGLDHPFFRTHYQRPPEGVEYISSLPALNGAGMKRDYRLTARRSFRAGRWIKDQIVMPAIRSFRFPRTCYCPAEGADLVHTRVFPMNRVPYVLEVEDASSLCFYSRASLESGLGRNLLRRSLLGEQCKAVLPWTRAAWRGLRRIVPHPELAGKTVVVHPAVAPRIERRAPRQDDVRRILFVGSGYYHLGFYLKGGLETLRAFRMVRDRFPAPVEIDLVCFAPPNIRAAYAGEPGVRFHTGLGQPAMDALFAAADLMVLPTHVDSLGYALLEACSWGLPSVSSRMFAVPEIVEDGVSGFTVPSPYNYFDEDDLPAFTPTRSAGHPLVQLAMNPPDSYVEALADRIWTILADEDTRMRMAQAALEQTRTGKFSFEVRNGQLKKIYEEAARHV